MRTHDTASLARGPGFVALLVSLAGCLGLVLLWLKPDVRFLTHLADDAFRYHAPTDNFIALGQWTFDGVKPGTGLHVLWGYFLMLLLKLQPAFTPHTISVVGITVQSTSLAAASLLLARTGLRLFGRGAGWGVLAALSSTMLLQGGWLMENAFAIFMAAVIVDHLGRERVSCSSRATFAFSAVIGWLLELARSDAGLLAAFLLLMHCLLARRRIVDQTMPAAALCVFAGAGAGGVTILLHTHAVLQASAQQKLFWSGVESGGAFPAWAGPQFSLHPWLQYVALHFGGNERLLHLSSIAGHFLGLPFAACVLIGAFLMARQAGALARGLLATFGLLAVSYCFLYKNADVSEWFVSSFAVTLALAAAAAGAWFFPRIPIIAASTVMVLAMVGSIRSLAPPHPRQPPCMYRDGVALREGSLAEATGTCLQQTSSFPIATLGLLK
ncbi:MAG: hypothetical protein ACRYGF_11020 [Janthinobacterium lividum]